MRIFSSQNLNEDRQGNVIGSMFWAGRAWLHSQLKAHCEWYFGHKSKRFHVGISFRAGEDDNGIQFVCCIPFIISLYLTFDRVMKCGKETELGFSIHDSTFYLYTFSFRNEWNSRDPWWRKGWSWSFPWTYDWYSTEVLDNSPMGRQESLWIDKRRKGKKGDVFARMHDQDAVSKTVQKTWPYRYVRKNGEVQEREATIHAERMTWRMKWWPLLPFTKSSTSICVKFNEEIGEGVSSWKGGCVGSGYNMLPDETPFQCLARMERERKFDR